MVDFRMPSLGADMEVGTLVEWLVKPGDRVKRGDVIAVVETQKGAIEIEIFETGQIEKILIDVGKKVPVGTPLAQVSSEEATKSGTTTAPAPAIAPAVPPAPSLPAAPKMLTPRAGAARATAGLRASPAARRLAQSHGIDLATIKGSGPDGAIVHADIERILGTLSLLPKKHVPPASISTPCVWRLPQPWPGRSGKSPIIILSIKSM